NPLYEGVLSEFIYRLLTPLLPNPFLQDFLPAQAHVARYGCLNSLSQMLLKLTSPGLPGLYHGTELWASALVDADKRLPARIVRWRSRMNATISTPRWNIFCCR